MLPSGQRQKKRKETQGRRCAGPERVPHGAKSIPAKAGIPPEPSDRLLIIRFDRVDTDGPWCPSRDPESWKKTLLPAIRNFESMTVHEAFTGGHPGKDYPSTDGMIKKTAKDRLEHLDLDDQDISRLRIGGTGRLYGFRRSAFFHVLWWDPNHEIWPSKR